MKNVILGILGGLFAIYATILTLSLYGIGVRKNELENCLSEVMESVAEEEFAGYRAVHAAPDAERIKEEIRRELLLRLDEDAAVELNFTACDPEKGILALTVRETFRLPTGREKTISYGKTLICEQTQQKGETPESVGQCRVCFLIEEEIYKEYWVSRGQVLLEPKKPDGNFVGWRLQGQEQLYSFTSGDVVQGTMILEAVFEA